MTERIGSAATAKVVQRLAGANGLGASLAALSTTLAERFDASDIHQVNVANTLAELTAGVSYPVVNVYCEKIIHDQVEKFRTFSGRVRIAVDVRVSHDRLKGLTEDLEIFADAVCDVLSKNRGDWADGMFYGGTYEVAYKSVKHGGRNFVQTAQVLFEIGVSKN